MASKNEIGDGARIQSEMLTRRRLLKGAAGIVAAAAAQALMPFNVRRVLAQGPPRQGSLSDIKHVVLLMQENRSFDHYFGTLAGVRGFDDPKARKFSNGRSVFYQPDAAKSQRVLAAISFGHARKQRAENSLDEPRVGCAARGVESRPDGPVAARAPKSGWGERSLLHGLSHARGYSVSICAGGVIHALRRIFLLCDGADVAEPACTG